MKYPGGPASSQALAEAWHSIQSDLATGWWITLYSEYGDNEAYWVAHLATTQDGPIEWPEAIAPTPEQALTNLKALVAAAPVEALALTVDAPAGPSTPDALSAAWDEAAAQLPSGWWIADLRGHESGREHPPGWFASAAGGPASGYGGAQ